MGRLPAKRPAANGAANAVNLLRTVATGAPGVYEKTLGLTCEPIKAQCPSMHSLR